MMKEEREARIRREQDFYNKCAEILNTTHNYRVPFFKKTRWNARVLGNGRFEGYGVIQMFSKNFIHMALNKPIQVTRTFTDEKDALNFLREIV